MTTSVIYPACAALLAATLMCQSALAQPILSAADVSGLSKHTRSVLNRYEACLHFAGEFSGDAALDKNTHRRITELHCDKIDHDVAQLRHRSLNKPRIINALAKIEREYDASR